MSDTGRKDFSDKVSEKVTPDSSKSTLDKAKEGITDTTDKAARGVQSDSSKSTTQEVTDKAGREKDHHKGGESVGDKIKGAIGLDKHS